MAVARVLQASRSVDELSVVLDFSAVDVTLQALVMTNPAASLPWTVPASIAEAVAVILDTVLYQLELAVGLMHPPIR